MNNDIIFLCGKHHRARIRRARWQFALELIALGIAVFIVVSVFAPLVLDAMQRETQWRADRLCAQGYYCDPKAGP